MARKRASQGRRSSPTKVSQDKSIDSGSEGRVEVPGHAENCAVVRSVGLVLLVSLVVAAAAFHLYPDALGLATHGHGSPQVAEEQVGVQDPPIHPSEATTQSLSDDAYKTQTLVQDDPEQQTPDISTFSRKPERDLMEGEVEEEVRGLLVSEESVLQLEVDGEQSELRMLDEDLPEVDSHPTVNISKQKAVNGNAHTAEEVETFPRKEEAVTPSNIELNTKDMPEVDVKLKMKATSRQNAVEGDYADSVEELVTSSTSKTNRTDLGVQSSEVRQAVEESQTPNSKTKQVSDQKETKKSTVGAGKGDASKTKKAKQTTKKKAVTFKAADSDAKGRKAVDDDLPGEVRNFKPTYLKTVTAKKIFADGRRIPPIELLPQKETNSSVRVFLFDEFLSEAECDGLRRVHDKHVQELKSQTPILCFDSITTLRKHLKNVKKKVKVSPNDFVEGTRCLNSTFSRQLGEWLKANWSYSTAFYPGESPFSSVFASRVNRSMGLNPENGGKFQITSYPTGKAYKEHTDCVLDGTDLRDRVASVLVYLNDVKDGGETRFPELGIWVKPKKGRALVWNNMSPDGVCEPHSRHVASVVNEGTKYVLIRWYYYQSFFSLGKRPPAPSLPKRVEGQPRVSCDEYDSGSCRWYDEWNNDHLLDLGQFTRV